MIHKVFLHCTLTKIKQFQTIIPNVGLLILLVTGALAIFLSFGKTYTISLLIKNCTIVLSIPVILGIVLQSIMIGTLDFSFAGFGLPLVFFGSIAFSLILFEKKYKKAT
jgi:hypothetical protein